MKIYDTLTFYEIVSSGKLETISLDGMEDITLFKNLGNLFVPDHNPDIEGDTSEQYEDDFETWIQRIDSNPIIFGYMQYIELVYPVLIEFLPKDEIKKMCDIIIGATEKQTLGFADISVNIQLCKPGYAHTCCMHSVQNILINVLKDSKNKKGNE